MARQTDPAGAATDGGDVDPMQYEVQLRNNAGQLEATLPSALVDDDGLESGQVLAFTPVLDRGSIAFRVQEGVGGHGNERRLRIAGDWDQCYLRFPKAFAVERGLFELVDEKDVALEIERQGELDYLLRTWPPTRPATYSEAEPIEEHTRMLYRNEIDDRHQYRLEFPQSFKDDDVLGLEAEQLVTFRLTVHDGQLATALELDSGADPKVSNVGTVFQTAQGQDPGYSNLGLVFLKPFANGLGYINDRRAKLRMSAYPGRILVEHTGEYETQ